MRPNPLLRSLGLADTDRVVLIHTDDIGMCHASLSAYMDLVHPDGSDRADGSDRLTFAGSTMTPCPWFPATAQFCVENADLVDMGVHITLNAEWRGRYRWGPVAPWTPDDGLVDTDGYLSAATEETQARARPEAVRREIAAQVQRALNAGIDVTHIDTHMGTVFHPEFLESYVQIALEHRIPPFLVRATPEILAAQGIEGPMAENLAAHVDILEAQGLPMFDDVRSARFTTIDDHLAQMKHTLSTLRPGLTYFITHPSRETPELQAIIPEHWRERVADYQVLMSEELRHFIDDQGIVAIGWRALRDRFRRA